MASCSGGLSAIFVTHHRYFLHHLSTRVGVRVPPHSIQTPILKSSRLWSISASSGDVSVPVPVEAVPLASSSDDGITNTVVSVLLTVAFVGLTILTIGVIYIAVTDFLQKREKDKFEKEEAANKKKGKKKVKVRAKTGPRGFGQKIEEVEDD